ncbi:MAG: hypothetical protein ACYSWU_00065 [Planctomycetota bacterium]|jgi:hypothetical protein
MLSGTPPTTEGIPDVYVLEDAPDEIIDLYAAFDDAEDADGDLTYEIVDVDETWVVNDSDPYGSLLDDAYIDDYGGSAYGGLVLDFADNAYGEAHITVRATDTDGDWVETTFAVYVSSVNDAPTTSGISDVFVDEDAANEVISLYDAFDDIEDPDEYLTYQVVGNSNSELFDSVDVDGYGGLVLDFAADAYGEGEITVRATDTDGAWVETTFLVDVAAVNDAPVISGFFASEGPVPFWTFSGTVTDVDDDVEGMIVVFGGVLAEFNVTATVQADGTFSLTDQFPGIQSGTATAQTEDPQELASNLALYQVYVT